jgi:hypothetical protein
MTHRKYCVRFIENNIDLMRQALFNWMESLACTPAPRWCP